MTSRCRLGVSYGSESDMYSFPPPHPMNAARAKLFGEALKRMAGDLTVVKPVACSEKDLLLFHDKAYVQLVKLSSRKGEGLLDRGDTPAFKGAYEASLYPVGNTLNGVKLILDGTFDHFFNPIGGLHHARSDGASGFCVFNDSVIAIRKLLSEGMRRICYVDIDAHHGDGVYYAFESDPRVVMTDIHEDGLYIFPGTGAASEKGVGDAEGTKLNIPLPPNAGDEGFVRAMDRAVEFVRERRPEFIFFQCGADGLAGDPITDLGYTPKVHAYAARKLHQLAHEVCRGRILAMGGGGYDPSNVSEAWTAVARELSGTAASVA